LRKRLAVHEKCMGVIINSCIVVGEAEGKRSTERSKNRIILNRI
jgi:hypothetical protein